MKKVYKKGKVHPSPPRPVPTIAHHLSLLPATILTLTAVLSLEDKEVLAYLISCSATSSSSDEYSVHRKTTRKSGRKEHSPRFECSCFRCYMSFWARWDSSPNRQLIHQAIETYEEGLYFQENYKNSTTYVKRNKKMRHKRSVSKDGDDHNQRNTFGKDLMIKDEFDELESVGASCDVTGDDNHQAGDQVELEKGSVTVRKIVRFIGETIWGVWTLE